MDYYIQGDAARAKEIKAAFEAKGCTLYRLASNCDSEDLIYYSLNGIVRGIKKDNLYLFEAHPGYKELELPVKPMFKVGDWVVKKDGETFYGGNYAEQITLIEVEEGDKRIWFSSTTWLRENDIRLWSIKDAKAGDVLANDHHILILKELNYGLFSNVFPYSVHAYCGIKPNGNFELGKENWCFCGTLHMRPATSEERDILFRKMKDAGFKWDADKKELRKIKHYDISSFHEGMPVLVRDSNDDEWNYLLFSHYRKKMPDHFFAGGNPWYECIPFEGNEHLLGTTDMCDEQYVNW